MGDDNPIRTLGDYSKPSHEGYRNTIELPIGNNVAPLRSDTIRLVQNGCSFHRLRSEDPNQHLKGFLKLVDSLDLDAHTERMERFKNIIFKQREEINGRMTEMFRLLKELTTSRTPEKVLKGKKPNSPSTRTFNNSRSRTQARKKKGKEYQILPGEPTYDAILKKKITKKEDIGGNFKIPCSIRNLKQVNSLIDQGSDVNVMPYSTYIKLTDEKPAETDIRLSLASHSYIYPLGIAEDVLLEVAEHIFPVDFVILDIKENEKRPFILGTLFLTTTKASIKFDTGTITQRSGKNKVIFNEEKLGSS
ncbi:MAK10-like protein [Tanacetum coccineum]